MTLHARRAGAAFVDQRGRRDGDGPMPRLSSGRAAGGRARRSGGAAGWRLCRTPPDRRNRPSKNGVAAHQTGLVPPQAFPWLRQRNLGLLRPLCVAQDIAAFGEVYGRVAWALGGVLLCTRHQCLLIAECPRCFHQAGYQPMNGRLRIWCWNCADGADTALKPDRIPFWPYGTPQQRRSCVTVTLSSEARPLLMRAQTDILAMLAGDRRPEGAVEPFLAMGTCRRSVAQACVRHAGAALGGD